MIIYSTVSSDVYFSLQNHDFFPFPKGYVILMNSLWFQQDWYRTSYQQCYTLLSLCCFKGESAVNWYPVLSWLSTPPHLNPCDYFLRWYLKDRVLQKSLHTIPEPKTSIQTGIKVISTDTLIKGLNSFVLHLQKLYGLWEHYMEHVSL